MTLHKAAEEGNLDVVRYWTEKDPASFNKTINYGLLPHIRAATPLHISAERGHLDVVKYLIEKNPASVDITDGGRKRTPLYWAAYQGHVKVIKYLVEEGRANVSSKDVGGDTPLHIAAGNGYLEVVKYLAKKNPPGVNITNNIGQTPLHVVAGPLYRGPHNVTKYLVEEGQTDTTIKENLNGWTPLHLLALRGWLDLVKYVAEKNPSEVNIKAKGGKTPLDLVEIICLAEDCSSVFTDNCRSCDSVVEFLKSLKILLYLRSKNKS